MPPMPQRREGQITTRSHSARRPDDAVQTLLAALELDPRSSVANAGLGEVYLMMGQEEQALAHFREAVEHSRGRAQIRPPREGSTNDQGSPEAVEALFKELVAQAKQVAHGA
jgi:hypothetical protein